jgi:hypothetical protein
MSLSETVGVLLAILGLLFAFETPRRWLVKTLRLDDKFRTKSASVKAGEAIDPTATVSHASNDNRPDVSNAYSPIGVAEIVSAINSAPPYQRDELSKKYNGVVVRWQGYLREARTSFHDSESVTVNLNIAPGKAVGNSFWFTEKLASFPDIKTLPVGAKLEVVGKIMGASGPGISVTIEPASIRVLDTVPLTR